MSKVIFESTGVILSRYAGPNGVAMFQLTVGRDYVQLGTLEMEQLIAGLRTALEDEDVPYEQIVVNRSVAQLTIPVSPL